MQGHVPAESRRQAQEAGRQPSHPIRKPTRSPQTPLKPGLSSLYGKPAVAIKPVLTLPASQTPFASLLTRPGSSARERPPNKGLHQRSIEVALSSRGVSYSHVQLFATLQTAACQAPLSMGFSRKEDWSGQPFPSQGKLPNSAIKPMFLTSPALAGGFVTTSTYFNQGAVTIALNELLNKKDIGFSLFTSQATFLPFSCNI